MDTWKGKVAVVTGASSGIGLEIVKSLAESGLVVVGLARRDQRIKELTLGAKGIIHAMKCDLSEETEIVKTFQEIEKTVGGVDLLINSAGYIKIGGLTDGNAEDWKTTLDINVLALCICTREAVKSMRRRDDKGQIVHINSIAGHTVPKYDNFSFGVYYASKHAVTALTETLRVELQGKNSQIKVTSISPGSVFTEAIARVGSDLNGTPFNPSESMKTRPPAFMDCKDVVGAINYVLSTPDHLQVQDMIIQPLGQKYS